jgi:hypothetical protein
MYKQHSSFENTIIKIDENKYIPKDEYNADYQKYLKWVAEGNTLEEADSNEPPSE